MSEEIAEELVAHALVASEEDFFIKSAIKARLKHLAQYNSVTYKEFLIKIKNSESNEDPLRADIYDILRGRGYSKVQIKLFFGAKTFRRMLKFIKEEKLVDNNVAKITEKSIYIDNNDVEKGDIDPHLEN